MAYTGHLVDVQTTPEYDALHDSFGNLLWLAGLERSFRPDVGNGTAETSPRASPAASPTGVRPEDLKLMELTKPVAIDVPPPFPEEELAACYAYVQRFRLREELEKQYIAFAFQEYKKRKSIEAKHEAAVAVVYAELDALRQRELPPEVRRALQVIEADEDGERARVHSAYDSFVTWVKETIPEWLAAVHGKEAERARQEAAKKAAMEAAKAALTAELLTGKSLSNVPATGRHDGASPNPYNPEDHGVDIDVDVDVDEPEVSESALRRKAIKMLEQEEVVVKQRRAQQLEQLRAEEEAMRRRLDEKQRSQQLTSQTEHEKDLQLRYASLLEQEQSIKKRIAMHDDERAMMLEHVAAEEQLLRERLAQKEAKRKAAEEEEKRMLYEHVRAEEALLRERLQKKETAAAEAKRQEEAVREVQRQQEEAMQRAKEEKRRQEEEHQRQERETQLAYLHSQEEAYKNRLRAKELAEIEAKDQLRHEQMQKDLQHLYQLAPPRQQPAPHMVAQSAPVMPSPWGNTTATAQYADPFRVAYQPAAPGPHPAMAAAMPSSAVSQPHAYGAPGMQAYYGAASPAPMMSYAQAPGFHQPPGAYPPTAPPLQPGAPPQGYFYYA